MSGPREHARRDILPSEKGFLALAGLDPDLPLRDVFVHFRDLVDADMTWADSRKTRFRTRASVVKVLALLLTAASTIVLGIPAIPNRAAIALPMVALVTLPPRAAAHRSSVTEARAR